MKRTDVSGTVLTFALGLGIGAVTALLLTPKSGDELCEDIADGVNDQVKAVRTTVKHIKQRAKEVANMADDTVQEVLDAGNNAYDQARKA